MQYRIDAIFLGTKADPPSVIGCSRVRHLLGLEKIADDTNDRDEQDKSDSDRIPYFTPVGFHSVYILFSPPITEEIDNGLPGDENKRQHKQPFPGDP